MKSPDHRQRLLQVAWLYSQGVSQTDIAKFFHLGSPTLVFQLLNEARKLRILRDAPVFNPAKCTARERAALKSLQLARLLLPPLQMIATAAQGSGARMVRRLHVVSSGGTGTTRAMMRRRVAYFGAGVAAEILTRICQSRTLGVTWGFTLAAAVAEVAQLDCTAFRSSRRRILSLAGEPHSVNPNGASSSRIAEQLGVLQGDQRRVSTLRGLPAFIPRVFGEHHEAISLYLQQEHAAYARIFGGAEVPREKALVSEIDTILSSAGALAKPLSPFVEELMKKSSLSLERLQDLAYGDMGGVLIPKENLSPDDAAEFRRVEAMWIGVKRTDLEAVVGRAQSQGRPGVVLLALGTNKAAVVRAAAQHGLVSELFIDIPLALTLKTLLEPEIAACVKKISDATHK